MCQKVIFKMAGSNHIVYGGASFFGCDILNFSGINNLADVDILAHQRCGSQEVSKLNIHVPRKTITILTKGTLPCAGRSNEVK